MSDQGLPPEVVEVLPTLSELVAAVGRPEQLADIADLIYSNYENGHKEEHGLTKADVRALLEHYGVSVSDTVLASLFQVLDEQGTGKAQLEPFCKYYTVLAHVVLHAKEKADHLEAIAELARAASAGRQGSPPKRSSNVPGFLKGTAASSSKVLPEKERRASLSVRERRPSSTSAALSDGPRLSISGLNVKPKDVAYLQRVFNELDSDKDGLVTWEAIRRKVPTLPLDPFKVTGLERDSKITMQQLLRLLYPDLTEEDAKIHASRTAASSELVLPEDTKTMIEEVFEVLDADGDGRLAPKDIVWHSEKMGQSTEEVAQSYVKLFFDMERTTIGKADFEQWYIEDMLSDKFKEANIRKKSATLIK